MKHLKMISVTKWVRIFAEKQSVYLFMLFCLISEISHPRLVYSATQSGVYLMEGGIIPTSNEYGIFALLNTPASQKKLKMGEC